MYKAAYKYSDNVVFYFDSAGNKYVASGGNLAWRINNPGLVRTRALFSRNLGSIGNFGPYAIFSTPEKGREALSSWLHTKKYFKGSIKTIAKHYQPDNADAFANRLSIMTSIPTITKIMSLNEQELDQLLFAIEKLCDYTLKGNEEFYHMPKILGKIEHKEHEDTYLIGGNLVLSKEQAIEWIQSHRLDAVIVRDHKDNVYLRSRPDHCIQRIRLPFYVSPTNDFVSYMRIVGDPKPGQCIWGFVNGINNTKEDALKHSSNISSMVQRERVLSLQNDTKGFRGAVDFADSMLLKASVKLPVIDRAIKFLHYLLSLEKKENRPIIIFAHSQGGIILEHTLEFIDPTERSLLRIFTFGGGSFIAPGACHPDSHNFASVADYVCLMGSPNLRTLALERYYAYKEGLTDSQMISKWALRDATLELDSIDLSVVKKFTKEGIKHYQNMFSRIKNLTILDPDPGSRWKHEFTSRCYQSALQQIIQKYRR